MDNIESNPDICNGKPVIKGTRITVQTIIEFLEAGNTIEEIVDEYPNLKIDETEYLLSSEKMKQRLTDALNRDEGMSLEEVFEIIKSE